MEIRPFKIDVAQHELDDLNARLDAARWPREAPVADWSRGVPVGYLKELAGYWRQGFDWRKTEAELNAFPQFTTEVDGQTIHFVHAKSREANALPLILCHGWPGSIVEFQRIIGPLVDPVAHGGKAEDAFDVVVPSLPGFGYSVPIASPGWDLARTTHAYAEVMSRLGYGRYAAHGSDIGSGIAGHLASFGPDKVVGVHVASDQSALIFAGVYLPLPADLTEEEKASLDAIKRASADGDGYMRQQQTKPQTLAYGLGDSPVGQLAWIAEKFAEWTNPAKPLPDQAVDRDQLLANISFYWFTNTGGSSAQFYWETAHANSGWTAPSDVPTGWAMFNTHPVARRVLDSEKKIAHWTDFKEGGHFPAMEEPDLLVGDIREFFRRFR
jgi:pimeloyl-ACP methyl ester carboxylesterase